MNSTFEPDGPPPGPPNNPLRTGQHSVPNFDEKVNADDLLPTSANSAAAPMPDDLPSYADYMGKFGKVLV